MENEHQESEDISSSSDQFSDEGTGGLSQWLQDNARIIISIAIVIAIAAGIYSYSNRAPLPISDIETAEKTQENIKLDETTQPDTTENKVAPKDASQNKTSEPASQETETAFVETAVRGEGTTHLARRALANYLEKSPDAALTPEHKIYIEDFLRKNVPIQKVRIGSSTEFEKDLIQSAIERSKNLNERQLNNLHKYVLRVSSLS